MRDVPTPLSSFVRGASPLRRARALQPAFALATLFATAASVPGCADASAQAVVTRETPCASRFPGETDDGWQSAPWGPADEGCWVLFAGGQIVQLEHDLGHTPALLQIYLSFDPLGQSSAPSAGDTSLIREVDDTSVTIANGTEQDFYLRVVAR